MIRRTRQRRAIEETFRKEGRPLSPSELHDGARSLLPGIGLRTIYRQLKDMSSEGLVVGVDYPGQPLRYEWVSRDNHAHFICRLCKRVYDLKMDVPDVDIQPPKGFKVSGQETVFYGICPDCRD